MTTYTVRDTDTNETFGRFDSREAAAGAAQDAAREADSTGEEFVVEETSTITALTIEAFAVNAAEHGDILGAAIAYRAAGRDDLAAKADLTASERAKLDAIDEAGARRKVESWIREAE